MQRISKNSLGCKGRHTFNVLTISSNLLKTKKPITMIKQ